MASVDVIEHGTSRSGRWLRVRRVRIALWIAVIEGLLVALHAISWWGAIAVAIILVGFYYLVGRRLRSDTARHVSWIAAASQALVALVPVLVVVIGTLAVIAVVVLAVIALIALFSERS